MESFGSWSVLTTNFLLILYIALNGVTLAAILHLVNAKWRKHVRFLSVSLFACFPIAFVLLIILLLNGESTFQWLAAAHAPGHGDHHMPGWHNYTFLVVREIVGFIVVASLYGLFIKYQHESTVDPSYTAQRRFRNVALLIPFAYVLYATMVAWDFEMTMIPSWHSASYGAYHFVSHFQFFIAFFAIFMYVLMSSGKLKQDVPVQILNFLAQMMLAFTILWTYLYFTQYLIMWYAMKFVIPFVSLIFARTRHTPIMVVGVATSICIGTWLERYTWISGAVDPEFYHVPMTSFFDVIVTALIAGVAVFAMRWSLHRYGLVKAS